MIHNLALPFAIGAWVYAVYRLAARWALEWQ